MKSIGSWYRRWRHTRGFGVHSPLAFRLVETVVKRHYGYYNYDALEAESNSSCAGGVVQVHRLKSRALLLHRLASRFPAEQVRFVGNVPEIFRKSILLAGKAKYSEYQHLTVAVEPKKEDIIELKNALQVENEIVALFSATDENLLELIESLTGGVALIGRDALIAVSRKDVAPVSYTVRI